MNIRGLLLMASMMSVMMPIGRCGSKRAKQKTESTPKQRISRRRSKAAKQSRKINRK